VNTDLKLRAAALAAEVADIEAARQDGSVSAAQEARIEPLFGEIKELYEKVIPRKASRRDWSALEDDPLANFLGLTEKARREYLERGEEGAALTPTFDPKTGIYGPPTLSARRSWTKALTEQLPVVHGKAFINPSGSIVAPYAFDPEVHDQGRPHTFIQSVIPVEPMTGSAFVYLVESVRDVEAAVVPPGQLKPTSIFTVERRDGQARVVATLTEPIDRFVLSDAPALGRYLDSVLRLAVAITEDEEIVGGSGDAAGGINGLGNQSGIQTQTMIPGDVLGTIRAAIGKVEAVYASASALLLNPADWEVIETAKDDTGRYYYASGPVDRAAARVWGVDVVSSHAIPQGVGYVGDFAGEARLYRRSATVVDWAQTVGNSWALNEVVFRAESRLQAAWLRPAAFVQIGLGSGSAT
jgi:HK97 family phage major capsid protein